MKKGKDKRGANHWWKATQIKLILWEQCEGPIKIAFDAMWRTYIEVATWPTKMSSLFPSLLIITFL